VARAARRSSTASARRTVVERSPAIQQMLVALVMENMAVAERAGVRLEPFDESRRPSTTRPPAATRPLEPAPLAGIATYYRAATKTKTRIWRGLAVRKRKTEVGALLGATVARARTFGLAMPLTERLIALIEELEAGRRPLAWANLDEQVAVSSSAR
jgi:2-dehydropantoate 2-reductase